MNMLILREATPKVRIRQATTHDAAQLAAFAEFAFRDTFGADNDPAQIDRYCRKTYSVERQRAELERENAKVLVACEADRIAAYAQLRFDDDDRCEIERFYVDRSQHGSGLAQQLMQKSIDVAKSNGKKVLWLGVWQHNARAVAFYRKLGFDIVGEQIFMLGTEPQTDYVMTKDLT